MIGIVLATLVLAGALIYWFFLNDSEESEPEEEEKEEDTPKVKRKRKKNKKNNFSVLSKSIGKDARRGKPKRKKIPGGVTSHPLLFHPLKPHQERVHNMAFSPDGKLLATCSEDRNVRVWKLSDKECTYSLIKIDGDYATAVAFGPNNKYVAVVLAINPKRLIRFYMNPWSKKSLPSVALTEFIKEFPSNHKCDVFTLQVAPHNVYLLTACNGQDVELKLWDPRDGSLLKKVSSKQLCNYGAAISPSGRFITAATMMADVKIWEVFGLKDKFVEKVEFAMALKGHKAAINCIRFGLNGLDGQVHALTASKDGSWKMWDVGVRNRSKEHEDAKVLKSFEIGKPINQIAVSMCKEHPFVAVSTGAQLRFFNYKTGMGRDVIKNAHKGDIFKMWFNAKGTVLATAGVDHHVRLWKTPRAKK